jgi:hypothetical protein
MPLSMLPVDRPADPQAVHERRGFDRRLALGGARGQRDSAHAHSTSTAATSERTVPAAAPALSSAVIAATSRSRLCAKGLVPDSQASSWR